MLQHYNVTTYRRKKFYNIGHICNNLVLGSYISPALYVRVRCLAMMEQGILKREISLYRWLTSCLAGLDQSVLLIQTKIVNCQTADSKPVKQEVNGTVILPPLVFPGWSYRHQQMVILMLLTLKIWIYLKKPQSYYRSVTITVYLQIGKKMIKVLAPDQEQIVASLSKKKVLGHLYLELISLTFYV